jgi:predicted metal-dependent HD superfamily phosphohydrolase
MSPERWLSLMHTFGVGPNLDTYKHLLIAYSEPHRHYHTTDHIIACLRQLDGALDLAIFPAEVEVALWFHDAIYSPAASENESRSAEWAAQFLSSAGVSREACQRVHQHIMATRHEAQPADSDSALVVDIDLSILGQDPSTYAEFEKDVCEEYRWVPWLLYRRKRREILQSFLDRKYIYATPHFRNRYEQAARSNLRSAIGELEK